MGIFSKLFSRASGPDPEIEKAKAVLQGKTIAIVESSITIQKVLELALAEAGAMLRAYSSPEALLKESTVAQASLAILSATEGASDLGSTVNEIRSAFPNLKVLLLTDVTQPIEPHEASRLGADGVASKPFMAKSILTTISNLISTPQ